MQGRKLYVVVATLVIEFKKANCPWKTSLQQFVYPHILIYKTVSDG